MPVEGKQENTMRRKLRLGMVGGGPGAFIGGVHRIAARLDGHYELVAGAMASDPARAKAGATSLGIASDRAYGTFEEMAAGEKTRPDRVDAVAIVTPNFAHHAPAKAFLEAGFHVICDKPVTTSLASALDLAETVKGTGLIFGLTHNYTGYPMVRQAREMVAAGEVGKVRVVQVEYAQDWLSTPLERTGQKQAEWLLTRRAAVLRDALVTSAPTLTISPLLLPACNVERSLRISPSSCRDGKLMTTFTSCSGIATGRAACCGQVKSRQAMKTIYGCASTASGRRSSGGRKTQTISASRH
jgi:hypothetical protein